ncbi:type III-B CRISPR module-associated protein Cmr5 [Pueribacillus theae]|uniref:CRISPR type III-B/RAMP module-associated protein Cmr5 n=1 Tax=Pueribacillus theae TaxID=2171751 RepID=A0A2U1K752_9BACI|nr:type III-B CRISPR module-associated protein Cmr5 [Pueribacillus theae]PWA13085.1 type III-B CRISPR module-associated protein Cmr5 [Pueribacillus theae]
MVNQSIHLVESGRAKFAYDMVKQLMKNNNSKKEEVRSYIKRLPLMIQTNGLGQALAFYYSKEKEHQDIYKVISTWFSPKEKHTFITIDEELIYAITKMNRSTYRMITNEVIELLIWMRRFADGYMKRSGGSQ